MRLHRVFAVLVLMLMLGMTGSAVAFADEGAQAPLTTAPSSAVSAAPAVAPAAPKLDSGDTAWMLAATALVMFMTPGLALFYGGMVRRKNVLGTMMHSFIILCMVSIAWIVYVYSMSFGPSIHGFVGNLDWLGLRGVGAEPSDKYGSTIPHILFMMYQGMFAIITPALITGAFAERMKFKALVLFSILWLTVVYAPVCHWVWNVDGWLAKKGALDFAGGTVVHINSAIAGLVGAFMLGKRKGYQVEAMPPHNLTLTFIGGAILWFGWFGFNAGSALGANGLAGFAFVNTNTGAAAAALGWSVAELMHHGKATVLGAVSGCVAGLVAITPAAGFVTPMAAIAIGIGGGVLCYLAVSVRPRLGYDDSLDVFSVHGIGGIWGALATGLFATKAINAAGGDGLFYGNPGQLGVQAIAVVATLVYSGIVSFILYKIVDLVVGLKVTEDDERKGLDLSQHGEEGYQGF